MNVLVLRLIPASSVVQRIVTYIVPRTTAVSPIHGLPSIVFARGKKWRFASRALDVSKAVSERIKDKHIVREILSSNSIHYDSEIEFDERSGKRDRYRRYSSGKELDADYIGRSGNRHNSPVQRHGSRSARSQARGSVLGLTTDDIFVETEGSPLIRKRNKAGHQARRRLDHKFAVASHTHRAECLSDSAAAGVTIFADLVAFHGSTRAALLSIMTKTASHAAAVELQPSPAVAASGAAASGTAQKKKTAPVPVNCDVCDTVVQDGKFNEHVAGKKHQKRLAKISRDAAVADAKKAKAATESTAPSVVVDVPATVKVDVPAAVEVDIPPVQLAPVTQPFKADEFIPLGGDGDVNAHGQKSGAARGVGSAMRDVDGERDGRGRAGKDARMLPWVRRRYSSDPVISLHEQIEDFVAYIRPTKAEHLMRMEIVERVRQAVKSIWPGAEVNAFGSFETGLYLPTSDVDLVVYGQWESPPLWTLARALEESRIVKSIKVIDKARVPIIKFIDATSNVPVDIGFNLPNGPSAAEFVKNEIRRHPAFLPLAYVLKQFLSQRALNEVFTGGLGSYSLLLMIASFLQMQPRNRRALPTQQSNLGVSLIEFFELYGKDFNYIRTGISVRNGGSYFPKADRGWYDPFKPSLLAIEDPHQQDNDISRNSFAIAFVRQAFRHGYDTLTGELVAARDWHSQHRGKADGPPLLSRILRVESDVVVFRSWVGENWGARVESAGAGHVGSAENGDGDVVVTREKPALGDSARPIAIDATDDDDAGGNGVTAPHRQQQQQPQQQRKRQSTFGEGSAKRSRTSDSGMRR